MQNEIQAMELDERGGVPSRWHSFSAPDPPERRSSGASFVASIEDQDLGPWEDRLSNRIINRAHEAAIIFPPAAPARRIRGFDVIQRV